MITLFMVSYTNKSKPYTNVKEYKYKGAAINAAKKAARYAPSGIAYRVVKDGTFVCQYSRESFPVKYIGDN